jgi:hypothetical protein
VREDIPPRILVEVRIQPRDGEETILEVRRLVAGGFLKMTDVQRRAGFRSTVPEIWRAREDSNSQPPDP